MALEQEAPGTASGGAIRTARARRGGQDIGPGNQTKSGLASGTTYWVALKRTCDSCPAGGVWERWREVTTSGAAMVRAVRFTNSPASGDTYLLGETIRAAVTWSQPVTVANGGSDDNVTLRLDLGADAGARFNNRRAMGYVSGSGTDTLVFEYVVQPGDMDADGVWLQAGDDILVFLTGGATIRNGTTDAKLTLAGLPTTGDATRKVDDATSATAEAGPDQEVRTGSTVRLSGSGSSRRASPSLSYRWAQTGGVSVTLSGAATASPTFTAPSVRTDLVFTLVVNDGVQDSAADTVTVRVRPPPNPTSAPCAHPKPADEGAWAGGSDWFRNETVTDSSISFQGRGPADAQTSFWFCWPDGVRDTLAENVSSGHVVTISSNLTSGTTYWVALKRTCNNCPAGGTWQRWRAFTTTGAATVRAVRFTNSPASGDTYLLGETIRAEVTWSQRVTVDTKGANANVRLRLDLGADDANRGNSRRTMAYVLGSGTDTLVFEYVVKLGDVDRDGVWLQTESEAIDFLVAFSNGATIRNGTTDAGLTRAGLPTTGDARRKVDGKAPSLQSASVRGTTLELTFDEALDGESVPAAVAFTVKRTPPAGSAERVRLTGRPAIYGVKVTLTLAAAAADGDAVAVGYTAHSANPLRDVPGNGVADFANRAVTNRTGAPDDATKPTLVQGKIGASRVELTFSEALDGAAVPAVDRFVLSPALGALGAVALSGRVITFTTATAVTATQSVSLGIRAPTGIRDRNGNALDAVSGFAIINTAAADPGKPALAATNPAVVDGATLTLTFDQTLHAAQVPPPGAFTVTVAGADRGVAGVAVAGSTVVLSLASVAAQGEAVAVTFDASKGTIQNPWGTGADGFTQTVANTTTNRPPAFTVAPSSISAPPLSLVSLDAPARDPDGDEVTFSLSLSRGDTHVPGELTHNVTLSRVFFMAKGDCELAHLDPAPASPLETVVTVTASDPHGATAKLDLTYSTSWGCAAPVLQTAAVDAATGRTVTLTFDKNLKALTGAQLSELKFAIAIVGAYDQGVRIPGMAPGRIVIEGRELRLHVGNPWGGTSAAPPGKEIAVEYRAADAATLGAALRGADDKPVRSFTRRMTRSASGASAPVLQAAAVAGSKLTLTFDAELDATSAPAGRRFYAWAVRSYESRRLIYGTGTARVSGKRVTVTMAAPFEQDERAWLFYQQRDDANPLRGATSGPEVADILGFLWASVDDRTPPKLASAVVAGTKLVAVLRRAAGPALDAGARRLWGDGGGRRADGERRLCECRRGHTDFGRVGRRRRRGERELYGGRGAHSGS